MLFLLGGCYGTSTVYRAAEAYEIHGRSMVMLESTQLPPFSAAGYGQIMKRAEDALEASPQVGRLTTRREVNASTSLSLKDRGTYKTLSNAVSLLSVVNQELAAQLGKALDVQLLSNIHLSYLACPACEEGDSLWLVGQVVDVESGKVVFRTHNSEPVDSGLEDVLLPMAEEMLATFLEEFDATFRLKWHRQRYRHLRPAS